MLKPESIDELLEIVRSTPRVVPTGQSTKPALAESASPDFERISMTKLNGILEYDPSEYTITTLAGTPLSTIEATLAENGQYLPFDPPLAAGGATIGGTVAAGLSGPGSYRFGPVRDFLIGIAFVEGTGKLITSGGKVVKNAAGFDLAKFLIGSCGRLGILAEVTFKVFPKPESCRNFGINVDSDSENLIYQLSRDPFELEAIEFDPARKLIWCRISGNEDALANRIQKISSKINRDVFDFEPESPLDFGFANLNEAVAKFPIVPKRIPELESFFANLDASRLYSMAGNVLYINGSMTIINETAQKAGPGLVLRSPEPLASPWIGGIATRPEIEKTIKEAFDPTGKFPPLN